MNQNIALNILHVEDDVADAMIIEKLIKEQQDPFYNYNITLVQTLGEALCKLSGPEHYNVILLDLNLPDGKGVDNIDALKTMSSDIPVVVVSGTSDESIFLQALSKGAQEYIVKEHNTKYIIKQVIQSSIFRKRVEVELSKRAYSDSLTGLPNRAFFEHAAQKMLHQAQRLKRKDALMFIDLNEFKQINDTYGHEAGNTILEEAAIRLKKTLRTSDLIARYAGDEFVVYMDSGKEPLTEEICQHVAEKIVKEIEKPIRLDDGNEVNISLSIGIAIFPDAGQTLDILLKKSDEAMYEAKKDGDKKYSIIGRTDARITSDNIKKILPEPSNKNSPEKTILIVDDNKADRILYKKMLSPAKYGVLEATSLREAERILEEVEPDCVLLGYSLPDGTGVDLLHKYKKLGRELNSAVVMVTGHENRETAIEAMKAGSKDYISKNEIDKERFVHILSNAIEKHQLERDLKSYQIELERSNSELSDFAHTVAHDLKAPMRKIFMFCQMLEEQKNTIPDEQINNYIERMSISSSRMQDLIDNLLSYSRIKNDKEVKEPTSLNKMVEEITDSLDVWLKSHKAKIVKENLPEWSVYSVRMQQLLTNLITNAVKYRSPDRDPVVVVSADIDDGGCHITVRDNGMGIPHEHLSKIFTPFYRLHAADDIEGSGLGLPICQKIAEKHGGKISVQSDEGKGSVFTISFPREVSLDKRQVS